LVSAPAAAQQADQLAELTRQFTQLHEQGKYTEAAEVARRSLRITEARFGPQHPNTAAWTNSLAEVSRELGRYAEAEPLYRKALAIWETALGSDKPEVGIALNNLALLLKAEGRFKEAEPLYRRVLSIWERDPGPDSLDVGRALSNLGELYREQGRYAEAEPLYKRSIAIREKAAGVDHPVVATALNNLALFESARGRFREAEPLFKRALSIWEKSLPPDHPYIATALDNLGEVLRAEARYAEAEPLYRRAITIREKSLGPDHPYLASTLNNLALLLGSWGRTAEAEPLLKRALSIREKALGPRHPDVAASLTNLAEFYRDQLRLSAAEPLYQRALAIWEAAFGPDHPHVATAFNNLGNLFFDQARPADAERAYKRALAIRERVLGPEHPEVSGVLNNLGWLAFGRSNWIEAGNYWRRATELAIQRTRRGADTLGERVTGKSRSETQREANHFAALVKAAYRIGETDPGVANGLAREMFKTVQWSRVSDAASSLALMAARAAAGSDTLAELARERQDLVTEWQMRDALLTAARSAPPQERDQSAEAALSTRLAAIDVRLAQIDKTLATDFPDYASLAQPEPLSINQVQAMLREDEVLVAFVDTPAWRPTAEETFVWLVSKSGMRWVRSALGTPLLLREVAALRCGLDRWGNWAWVDEDRHWSATSDVCKVLQPDGLGASSALPFDLGRSHALYKSLFGEVEDQIKDKNLLIVPSGALNALPFGVLVTEQPTEALPAAEDGYAKAHWLGMHNALTVLPAVSSLKALRANAKASRAAAPYIGFGNPLLTGPEGTDKRAWEHLHCAGPATTEHMHLALIEVDLTSLFRGGLGNVEELRRQPPLPETADELCQVARARGVTDPDRVVNLGERATVARVKALSADGTLARSRIVHFATHGLVAGETALFAKNLAEPSLLLTPPEVASEEDDGLLTASEIATLKLDADWVILSACNTASGDSVGGDALSGLARAFFYAGARALLVSHWYVDSEATVALVTKSFDALQADPKIGRAEALRRATSQLIEGGGRTAHPANWAPFVVVGEGGGGL
jgi:CHAT domain-containing protein/tetratricopeptide (TPR) repeat protein